MNFQHKLAQKEKVTLFHYVGTDGKFITSVREMAVPLPRLPGVG